MTKVPGQPPTAGHIFSSMQTGMFFWIVLPIILSAAKVTLTEPERAQTDDSLTEDVSYNDN